MMNYCQPTCKQTGRWWSPLPATIQWNAAARLKRRIWIRLHSEVVPEMRWTIVRMVTLRTLRLVRLRVALLRSVIGRRVDVHKTNKQDQAEEENADAKANTHS